MKAIGIILDIVIALAIVAGTIVGCYKFANTYSKAMAYSDLNQMEKGILAIADRDQYEDLHDSYSFIIDLPLIGETL